MTSPRQMPGSFQPPDNEAQPSFRCAPFQASLFLTPAKESPSPSSSFTTSVQPQSISATQSRKRPRVDPQDDKPYTPYTALCNAVKKLNPDSASPAPFVTTDYRIAGGIEAPADLNAQRQEYERELEYEDNLRPNRYTSQPTSRHLADSYFPQTPSTSDDYARPQRALPNSSHNGWGKTVWSLTGNVAGKVFNFCWQSAASFKGFYAGGGNSYHLDIGTPTVTSSGWTEVSSKEDVFHHDYVGPKSFRERASTPVPGEFPEQPEFIEDYMSRPWKYGSTNDSTPTVRPALAASQNSWVVVDGPSPGSRDTSPARKKSRVSVAPLSATAKPSPRGVSNHGYPNSRPRLAPRNSAVKSSASVASPRASLSGSTNSTTYLHSRQPSTTSTAPSAAKRHNSRASLASSRRQSSHTTPQAPTSQASPEVRKFEQKIRRKAAKEDESIRRLNEQLKAMIKEGQQALGSRVEVVDGDDGDEDVEVDEGFVDGEEKWEREYVRPSVWS